MLDLKRGPFAAAAEIAANPRARDRPMPGTSSVTAEMRASLDHQIDGLLAEHPLSPAFVVPGATRPPPHWTSRGHACAGPRRLVAARDGGMSMSAGLIAYVNRASDLAYVLARRGAGDGDEPLSPSERVRVLSAARPSGSRLACPEMTNRRRSDREQLGSDGDLKRRLPEILSWTAVARDRARPRGG